MKNGYCFLTDNLPTSITINNKAIELDTKTSTAVAILLYIRQDKTNFEKASYMAYRLFHRSYNELLQEFACEPNTLDLKMLEYLQGFPIVKATKTASDESSDNGYKVPTFDYVQDSAPILASFRQAYGMSIREVQNLHYWEFLALFQNLPSECAFEKIREIRTMKIDKKHDSPERQEAIRKAKRAVAIKDTRTEEQKRQDLQEQFNALM